MRSLRFFKNSPELRFRGIFHERLTIPDQNYSRYVHSDIRIIHKPWCQEDINRKMQRNVNLLKKHITSYQDDIYQILDLIRLYLETERVSEAEKLLDRVFILLSSIGPHERNYELFHANYYLYKLKLYAKKNIDLKDTLSVCEKAILIVPQCPLFLYEAARIHYELKNYDNAVDYFRKCLAIGESDEFCHSVMFPKDILGAWPLTGLGHCFFKGHDYKKAARYFNKSYTLQKNEKVMAMIHASSLMIKKEEEGNHQASHIS